MMTERQEREMLDNDYVIVEDTKPEKCFDCPLNRVCLEAFHTDKKLTKTLMPKIECYYEVNGQFDEKRKLFNKWQSFTDTDPKYFMEKMMITQSMLEQEALKDFTFAKGMQLMYLDMSIYKMKFGERKQIETSSVNASIDIKQLMDKMRDDKE